jgi:hypothetical protein
VVHRVVFPIVVQRVTVPLSVHRVTVPIVVQRRLASAVVASVAAARAAIARNLVMWFSDLKMWC